MNPTEVLTTLRRTYCGACFDSFENFSLQLQEFMSKYSLQNFESLLTEPRPENFDESILTDLKGLLNSILSSQIPQKKIIFCRDCKQTIHLACLPNKSYKKTQEMVFLDGVHPITTFQCCICQQKTNQFPQLKEKKSKVNGACMECTQVDGFRLALQGKKRDVLLSQFVHPICALFSSVIAPKNLGDLSFFR
jgi:hypothetical protein